MPRPLRLYQRLVLIASLGALAIAGVIMTTLFEPDLLQTTGQIAQRIGNATIPARLPSVGTEVTPSPTEPQAEPRRIRIPRLEVDAIVTKVGLKADGAMEVPARGPDVGWFRPGVKPGERGNAVMAGHLDTFTGNAAVFRRLQELEIGDDIFVYNASGATLHFRVTGKDIYSVNGAPMERIFGPSDDRRLNLITCDGIWDEKRLMYDKRLVVFTELSE